MISILLLAGILALAIPVGFLLAWLARDELIDLREKMRTLVVIALAGMLVLGVFGKRPEAITMLFIAITAYISYVKSFHKRWTSSR